MSRTRRPAQPHAAGPSLPVWLAAAALGAAASAAAQGPAPSTDAAALVLQGARIFEREGCPLCHRIGGAGGMVGPPLDGIAVRHPDAAWYVRFLKDPAAVAADAKMPPFDQLTGPQLQALAAYLLSLQ